MTDSHHTIPAINPTSPGAGRIRVEGKTSLCELPWIGKINLRGNPDNAKFLSATAEVLGIALPLRANTTATGGEIEIFWLGPDEWLVYCVSEQTAKIMEKLAQKFAGIHHAVTEVTDYYTVLELDGKDAAAVLARGCPLDLHKSQFKAKQCAQSRFGNASIMLYQPGNDSMFRIQVRWSFTEYVWDYLVSAMDSL